MGKETNGMRPERKPRETQRNHVSETSSSPQRAEIQHKEKRGTPSDSRKAKTELLQQHKAMKPQWSELPEAYEAIALETVLSAPETTEEIRQRLDSLDTRTDPSAQKYQRLSNRSLQKIYADLSLSNAEQYLPETVEERTNQQIRPIILLRETLIAISDYRTEHQEIPFMTDYERILGEICTVLANNVPPPEEIQQTTSIKNATPALNHEATFESTLDEEGNPLPEGETRSVRVRDLFFDPQPPEEA